MHATSDTVRDGMDIVAAVEARSVARLGGIPDDTPMLGSIPLRSALEHYGLGYREIRDYVRRREMPAAMDPHSDAGRKWVADRTWDRAVSIKRDHLAEQNRAPREQARALWEWQDELRREARALDEPLESLSEISSREPYTRPVYRGDTRSAETVFAEGFQPWGENTTIQSGGSPRWPPDRNYVYTTEQPEIAAKFVSGEGSGFVYVVEDARGATDMNDHFGPDYDWVLDEEVVFMGGIPVDKVKVF